MICNGSSMAATLPNTNSIEALKKEITKYHEVLLKERIIKQRLASRLDDCLIKIASIRADIMIYDRETNIDSIKARGTPFQNDIMTPVIRNRNTKLAKFVIDRIRARVSNQP